MLLFDANVVLAAARDDHPHHAVARPWFDRLLSGDDQFGVPVPVWHAFLRLATHRRIFPVPMPRDQALAFVHAVRLQPHHIDLTPGPRHLALLQQVCTEADATGDLIPDAVLAAIALEHHCEVVTFDRDFARFPSVRHRRLPTVDPL